MIRYGLFLLALFMLPAATMAKNNPPIADAGTDQTMFLGNTIVLHGSATDPDGDPIAAWSWGIVSKPMGSTPAFGPTTDPNPRFQPDLVGDYVFSLTVRDGTAISLTDTVTVSVVTDQPPIAKGDMD